MAKADHGQSEDLKGRPWHSSAVIYEVDVKNFRDTDGDGCGDFKGLIDGLDYIASLNVQCIWLQPFYKTPNRDNGYDIADYYTIDPRLGTMDDFDRLIAEAKKRELRVIADLPLNHVSNEHHWFQDARKSRNSPFRNYFVWEDEKPKDHDPYPVFGPAQDGNWKFDDDAGQWYFHTFYPFMPDLNYGSSEVRRELLEIARFWMRRGLSGFRLDAVPFMVKDTSHKEKLEMPHQFLKELHTAVREVCPEAVLIAEANLKPKEMRDFFGDGDEMDQLLNFYLCNHIILAVATEKAEPIRRAWDELPKIPKDCHWANFIRNHDELSLDQLTKAEMKQCFDAFAPQENQRLYDRGIRRRLAPMMNGDLARIKLTYSLLFSLPGTPVVNLGEEIGLGDDLSLKEREAGRTPMQWDASNNGGFSSAPREKLIRPSVTEGPFAYDKVSVAKQDKDPQSLLNFFRGAIKAYHDTPELGIGEWSFVVMEDEAVLLHECHCGEGDKIYAFHNLSNQPKTVQADLPGGLTEFFCDSECKPIADGKVELKAYGYRWLKQANRRDE